jgi:LysM repeat protein
MTKKTVLLIVFLFSIQVFSQDKREIEYIINYAKLAVTEMQLYKIPASITLSQGMLETGGGQSRLAEQANNHFGIKCKVEWTGEKIYHDDDALGECFRKYPKVDDSYRDHSKFLAERPYYKNLFTLPITDYKSWAYGLKKAGYATNPNYAGILINKIEKYNLFQFDGVTPEEVDQKLATLFPNHIIKKEEISLPIVDSVLTNKLQQIIPTQTEAIEIIEPKKPINPYSRVKIHESGLNYIVVEKGETIASLSKLYKINKNKLLVYNDLINPILLQEGQMLFFSKKKLSGIFPDYVVQKDDTMYAISQKMGIRLGNLYRLNKMKYGEEPQMYRVLELQ